MDKEGVDVWLPSQAAARREAKRRPAFYTYLNLWPFVAVLLVLLIIFMVNSPPHHDIGPDLPSSYYATAQPKARAEDAMKIFVLRDGRVYFRNQHVRAEELPGLVRSAVQDGAEKKVYLVVDSRARYSDAAAVVEQIGQARIREICFLVYKREK